LFSNIVNQNIMEAKIVLITGADSGMGEDKL
jgi:NADP-dependent 3-hydroxy acid dehydrogenase YdfG